MTIKKVVRYIEDSLHLFGGVGYPAALKPINHPDSEHVSNTTYVLTSLVVAYDSESGQVETLNTMYVPERGTNDN